MAPSPRVGSCSVGRHHGRYLVPAGHPSPADVRRRLDRVMERRLPEVAGRLLAGAFDSGDASVWLVRSLEVELSADLGSVDDERLARGWAGRFAGALGELLARGPDGESVLRFDDRGAYLARFVEDLAGGRAWGRWCYQPFASLRSLGTGGAVREALVREPEWVAPVLVRLAEGGGLPAVLGVLGAGDARRILAAVPAAATPLGERRTLAALAAVWRGAGIVRRSRAHAVLGLYAHAAARFPELAGCPAGSIDRLFDLAALLARLDDPAAFLDRLAAGDLGWAVAEARRSGTTAELAVLPAVARLAQGDAVWLEEIGRALATEGAEAVSGQVFASPFAAVFFLLPSAVALRLGEIAGESAVLRRVLARCFGRARAAARDDPALLEASGLEPGAAGEALDAPDEEAGVDVAAGLREILARERRVDGRCLAAELVRLSTASTGRTSSVHPGCVEPHPGLRSLRIPNPRARGSAPRGHPGPGQILLLRDVEHDYWLVAEPVPDDGIAGRLLAALESVRQAVEAPVEHLVLGTDLGKRISASGVAGDLPGRLLWRQAPEGEALAPVPDVEGLWAVDPEPLDGEAAGRIRRFLARSRAAAPELEYLCLDTTADLAASLAARAVLRHFAGRLMGFGWSGCEFLYRNFLAGEGTVRRTAEGLEVTLPRAPLHLVARMAGADGMSYTVPWLGDQRVTLSLPEV